MLHFTGQYMSLRHRKCNLDAINAVPSRTIAPDDVQMQSSVSCRHSTFHSSFP
jgi:hypothetical protein